MRTEADEFAHTKTPFQKFMQVHKREREERSSKGKFDKTKHFLETKNLNLKKLNLGSELCKSPLMQMMESRIRLLRNSRRRHIVARITALGRRMNLRDRVSRRLRLKSTYRRAWRTCSWAGRRVIRQISKATSKTRLRNNL